MNKTLNISILLAMSFVFTCIGDEQSVRDDFIRSHRPFWFFTADADNGRVHLNFSKSHWYHYNSDLYGLESVFEDIRIYRIKVDMNWAWDRAEVLDSLICELGDENIIFRGPIEPKFGKTYEFYDDKAEKGNVYAYFVSAGESPATGPVAVKMRDPDIWWNKEKIAEQSRRLVEDFPDIVRLETAGKSCRGNDIHALVVGSGEKKVCLIGAVHASESGPELIIGALWNILETRRSLLNDVSIIALPCLNIDERDRVAGGYPFYLRRNAIDVDLNRNFPADWDQVSFKYGVSTADPAGGTYRGASPASEPETKAAVGFLRKYKPEVVFSYHHLASVSGKCLWAPAAANGDQGYKDICMGLYDAYDTGYSSAPTLPGESNSEEKYLRFASTSGSIPCFCYKEWAAAAFDVERHWDNDGLEFSMQEKTTPELFKINLQQHTGGLIKVMEFLRNDGAKNEEN